MTRRVQLLALALAIVLPAGATVPAQTPAPTADAVPFALVTRPRFKTFLSPIGNFQVQYPDSDWTVLSGVGDATLTLVENRSGSAFVLVERVALRTAFAPEAIPALAQQEAATIKQRNAAATNIRHQVLEADKRHVVVVQYSRTGVKGPEQVVHYAAPIGETMYRVTCVVVEKEYARYAPIFGHIAASVQPAATPVTKK